MSPTSYQAALPRSLEFLSVVHSLVRVNDVVDLKCFRGVNKAPKAQLFQTHAASLLYVRPLRAQAHKHPTKYFAAHEKVKKKRAPRRIGGLSEVTVSVKYLSPFSNSST
jgi:hypothetical protein